MDACYASAVDLLAGLPTPLLVGGAGVLGLVIGSFLNVVIHRLPRGESIVRPPSHCPGCQRRLAAWENVPILSWLVLRGRCRGCRAPISPRYPAIELLTGLLFATIALRHGPVAMLPVWLALAAALVAAAAIDFDHRIIPDEISLGGLAIAVVLVPVARSLGGVPLGGALLESLAGAALGAGILWIVGFAHARLAVATGRHFDHWPGEGEELPRPGSLDYWTWFPGLGFGDVKLLAMIGAAVGPLGVVATLVAASCAGLLLGLVWGLVHRRWDAPFGFAPALAAGAVLVILGPSGPFAVAG